MKLSTLLALTPAAVAALSPIPAEAATYFLKLEGIAGDSTDKVHKEWIELQSWSLGLTADSSWVGGRSGASVGKPNPGPLAVSFTLSKASPALYSAIASGKSIPSVTLAASKVTSSATLTDFYTVKLEGVYLTSAKANGAAGDNGPLETFTMIYRSATWSYSVIDSKGAVSGKPTTFGWDFVDSKTK